MNKCIIWYFNQRTLKTDKFKTYVIIFRPPALKPILKKCFIFIFRDEYLYFCYFVNNMIRNNIKKCQIDQFGDSQYLKNYDFNFNRKILKCHEYQRQLDSNVFYSLGSCCTRSKYLIFLQRLLLNQLIAYCRLSFRPLSGKPIHRFHIQKYNALKSKRKKKQSEFFHKFLH